MSPREAIKTAAPKSALHECVTQTVRRYLSDMDSHHINDLYDLVLKEVEAPLLCEVLAWHQGNQSKAAAALGMTRATFRKKLQILGLNKT